MKEMIDKGLLVDSLLVRFCNTCNAISHETIPMKETDCSKCQIHDVITFIEDGYCDREEKQDED